MDCPYTDCQSPDQSLDRLDPWKWGRAYDAISPLVHLCSACRRLCAVESDGHHYLVPRPESMEATLELLKKTPVCVVNECNQPASKDPTIGLWGRCSTHRHVD